MAPADTTLTADTRYFVVYVETGVGGASVASTPQTSEDGGASPGWSIDDRRYYVSYDNDDGWKPVVDAGGGVPRFALNPPGATADTTAPALTTATVDGTSLVLTYDEALDENSVPAAAAYAVNVDGGGATAPASVAVGGSAVTLTLGTTIIGGQTVTVSYTVRSSNPVQDVPGNDAAALTGRLVTNLSNTPATGRPQISGTAQVGQTLTASTGDIADTDGRTKADGGEPGHAYTYQWIRVDGDTDTDIAGATSRTYDLTAANVGAKVKVKVGFTDDDGNAEEVESDAFPDTGTVLNAPREPLYLCGVEVGPAIGVVIGAHVDLCWETGDELPTGDDVEMEWRLKSFWGMDNPEPWNQWREFARGNAIDPCTPSSTTCVKFRVGRFPRGFPFTLQARIRRGGAELSPPLSATLEAAMPNTDTTALVPELSQPLDEATGHGIDSVTGPFVLELVFAEPVGNGFLGALSTEAVRGLDPGDFEATNATVDAVEIWDGGVYKVSVTPTDLGQPVTVELPAGTVKGVGEGISAAGTNDFTRDNVTSNRVSTASAPDLPGLSVKDASVEEGENASLKFEVTLDRKASETVTVDYATSDGSATAGLDYTQVSDTLIFAPGETKKTVSVTVLNDDINEESETLKLTLSNPSSGAYLAGAEATGTITNSDPIPKAWIARFGRTVADQVLDAVDERLRAARSARAEVTLGGRRIGLGSAFGQEYGDGEGTVAPVAGPASPLVATAPDSAWLGATAQPDAEGTARLEALGSWLNGDATEDGLRQAGSRTMSGRELLAGSSFSLAAETDGGGGAALWGRMAHSGFSGREGTLALDGDVTTGLLGADYARERWTAGLVVSRSIGEGGFRGASSGYIEATMTAVTPWAGYAVSDRLSVWGAAGRGTGDLTVKPAGGAALSADLGMTLATAGARARLAEGDGPRLDAVADARWVRTTSARVTSSAGNLAPATAQVTRLRLGLDGSWPLALGGGLSGEAAPGEGAPDQGATLTPRLGLGLRHDGGDAETGYGVDISGGVDLAAPARGLAVSLDGRGGHRQAPPDRQCPRPSGGRRRGQRSGLDGRCGQSVRFRRCERGGNHGDGDAGRPRRSFGGDGAARAHPRRGRGRDGDRGEPRRGVVPVSERAQDRHRGPAPARDDAPRGVRGGSRGRRHRAHGVDEQRAPRPPPDRGARVRGRGRDRGYGGCPGGPDGRRRRRRPNPAHQPVGGDHGCRRGTPHRRRRWRLACRPCVRAPDPAPAVRRLRLRAGRPGA